MKNVLVLTPVVLAIIIFASTNALASGLEIGLQPLAANTPTEFHECEHTFGDPITGHWTRIGDGFVGTWENGAHARLQLTENDPSAIVIERQDPSGTTTGLTATYVGKMA